MSETAVTHRLRGEVETSRPLRARTGTVSVTGWSLIAGLTEPPPVRLATTAGNLALTKRTKRPDLAAQLPGEPAAARCGFTIEGRLPAGVHLAHFEAQLPDGPWERFKTLTLVVEAPPFVAGIESPSPTGKVSKRVHVEGWALHPRLPVQELSLRYGHQEISCELNRPRSDVPAAYPDSPHAARSGFKSKVILSAGRGPLRFRAKLADGSVALARSLLQIDVATDENHGARIDFGAIRVSLPGPKSAERYDPPSPRTDRPLNILFLLPGSFASNSALHVAALADELSSSGHACAVAVAHDLATLAHHTTPRFRGLLHQDAEKGVVFADGRGPQIIHAWTTRENVRVLAEKLRTRHGARIVVHLEDNEQEVLAHSLGRSAAELEKMSDPDLARLVPADLTHPRRGPEFLAQADAITVIIDKLQELAPAGRPCHTIWPAADARYFHPLPRPDAFRRQLDVAPGETVLFYHGNVHAANAAEVRELYAAVLQLNRSGTPVTLIRTGLNQVDFLGTLAAEVTPHVLSLGQILHHHHLPTLMALADIFVQPGLPGAFNDYRFPSKLPEFFSIGRPVVLPRANLGATARHGVDAYVLDRADATGIAAAVTELRSDRALADRLSAGALAYAEKHFSWRRSAEALAEFYRTVVR
jgi:glycosyltransferase involved in cell wall biosynthesis